MTVAQLALKMSLITVNYAYFYFFAVFLIAGNSIRVNYRYRRLHFGMFSGRNVIL